MQDRAWLAAVFAAHHITGENLTYALKAMNATTGADLQRVAKEYLGIPTIALVLPRSQGAVQGSP